MVRLRSALSFRWPRLALVREFLRIEFLQQLVTGGISILDFPFHPEEGQASSVILHASRFFPDDRIGGEQAARNPFVGRHFLHSLWDALSGQHLGRQRAIGEVPPDSYIVPESGKGIHPADCAVYSPDYCALVGSDLTIFSSRCHQGRAKEFRERDD